MPLESAQSQFFHFTFLIIATTQSKTLLTAFKTTQVEASTSLFFTS